MQQVEKTHWEKDNKLEGLRERQQVGRFGRNATCWEDWKALKGIKLQQNFRDMRGIKGF